MNNNRFYALLAVFMLLLFGCSEENKKVEEEGQLKKIEGYWEGTIQVPNQPLPISVTFDSQNGAISIPVQGVSDFPLTAIDFADPDLHFEMNVQNQQLVFEGAFNGDTISGLFTQQGQTFLLNCQKLLMLLNKSLAHRLR